MIVGDYYINNYFLAFIVSLVVGGLAVAAGVPSIIDGDTSPENTSPEYDVSLLGDSTAPGSSQVIRLAKENGSVVPGAEVFVNGQQVGQTGESGEIVFEVPDSNNLTVSASKFNSEVTETFEINDSGQDDSSERDSRADNSNGEDQGSEDDSEGSDRQQDGKSDDNQENNTQKENDTDLENGTSQSMFIEKVSPENSELSSSSFEMILDLGANSSTYQVSLGGEEKLSGEIDGNKTVNSSLEMPRNGTVGLYVEILKNEEVKYSRNYSLSYEQDNSSDIDNNLTADISEITAVSVGNEFTLDASNSTGEIDNYTWRFGDGSIEKTQSSEVQHIYDNKGNYDISLIVRGPDNSKDSINRSISVVTGSGGADESPEINFISPPDGYDSDQSSIDYEFEVNYAESGAEYEILIDQSVELSGTLEAGNNTIQETVEIPETPFNTSIRVNQGAETYNSEKKAITPSYSVPHPDVFLKEPDEGSEYSSTEVEYNFTVYNGLEGSTYRIMTDGNSAKTGQLGKDGTITLDPTVTVPEGEFTTKVEVDQGGQTNSSESVSLMAGQTGSDPSATLDHPNDGETVSETFDETIDVSLNFTVEERGWAQEATVTLENHEGTEVGSRTQAVSSGRSYSYTFEDIKTYKQDSKAEYIWKVNLNGNGESTTLGPRSFLAERLEHVDVTELHSVEQNESYSGVFNYSAMSNSMNGRVLEIVRNDTIIAQRSKYESFDIDNRVEEFWIYEKGYHNVKILLRDVSTDEVVAQSRELQFETTKLPPDTGGGGGS